MVTIDYYVFLCLIVELKNENIMKVSLNAGAMEYNKKSKENNSIYIGDYSRELSAIGIRNSDALDQRKKLKAGSLIEIKRGSTRLEKFVSDKIDELGISEKGLDFERVQNFFTHRIRRLRYIDKLDYDKIKANDYDKKKSGVLQGYDSNLADYIDDFALMILYAKALCFDNNAFINDLKVVRITNEQRKNINAFYSKLTDSKGVGIGKIIIIGKRKNEKLEIDAPILVKMILYNFAKEYYTRIEKVDKEHWENEIGIETIKKGDPGYDYSKYMKAIIHVFFSFIEHEKLLEGISKNRKYALIGRLLVIAGFKEYGLRIKEEDYKGSYVNEYDYYYKTLRKYWQHKRT